MSTLTDLLNTVKQAQKDLTSDEKFRHALNESMTALELRDIDVATALSVSRTTVGRWRNGTAIPHELMRKPVYRVLVRRIQERIRSSPESSVVETAHPFLGNGS